MAETKKVKVGVVGVGRGTSMMRYCECSGNAEIVAICDNWEQGLKDKLDDAEAVRKEFEDMVKDLVDVTPSGAG